VITESRDVPKQASSGHHQPEPGCDDLTAVVGMTRPVSEGEVRVAAATVAPTITRTPAVSDHVLRDRHSGSVTPLRRRCPSTKEVAYLLDQSVKRWIHSGRRLLALLRRAGQSRSQLSGPC
jgi:hypothetical protein